MWGTLTGHMVDMRSAQGVLRPVIVDAGTVTLTTNRIVFNGSKKREWAFDKLTGVEHVSADTTLMKVTNRENPSGVRVTDAERGRLLLDLALAMGTGRGRDAVVDRAGQALHGNERQRPTPPPHPRPPPAPYVPLPRETQDSAGAQVVSGAG